MINNRQGGRRRGRGGGGNGQRQGGQQGNGSRIDNRARGNANQLYEKYKNMAADAQRAGDRVNTEYYLQFADHYFRVLSEQRGGFEQQQRARRDEFDLDGDDEFGDEGEPVRGREQWVDQPERAEEGRRDDGRRDEGRQNGRDESRPNDGRQGDGRSGERREFRNDGRREWRDRPNERRNGEPRDARPAEPELVAGQRRAEPLAADESVEVRAAEVIEADRPLDPPAPRRRGRPRRDEAAAIEGAPAPAFDAERLPPALSVPANDAGPVEGEAKPRRRRVRTAAEEAPTAAE